MSTQERLALDLQKWATKTLAVVEKDFATAVVEQNDAPPEQRINADHLFLAEDGSWVDRTGRRVDSGLSQETLSDLLENEAWARISELAKRDEDIYILWISPSWPGIYRETRFMVFGTRNLKARKYKKKLWFRAFPGHQSQEECLVVARDIASSSTENVGPITNHLILRANPIPFRPPADIPLIEFLEERIGPPGVWELVRRGEDLKAKKKSLKVSRTVTRPAYARIQTAQTDYERLVVGAHMEAEATRGGFRFQAIGSHGLSNQEALRRIGIFDRLFHLGEAFVVKCPNCDRKINAFIRPGYQCACGQTYEGC